MENYNDVLRQMNEAGLLVRNLEVGRLIRCQVEGDREKRGWYILHTFSKSDGSSLLVGSFGIWHGTDNCARKIEFDGKNELTPEQRAAINKKIKADQKAAAYARKQQAETAARRASIIWSKLSNDGENDYLTKKAVQNYGGRFSPEGALALPMTDVHGNVHGLQVIYHSQNQTGKIKRLGACRTINLAA